MTYIQLMNEGQICIQNKQYKVAENLFMKVVSALDKEEDNPERTRILAEAYNNLGYICYKKVEFIKALAYYDESIELNTSYGIAYYNRGTIHYRLGCYEAAFKDMEKAVLFVPDNTEFINGLEACRRALVFHQFVKKIKKMGKEK